MNYRSPLFFVVVAVLGGAGALISELIFDETINWFTVLVVTPLASIIGMTIGLRIYERRQAS